MKITGPWITTPHTQSVCAALTEAGYQALFVGGCVRNALLGQAVSDIDISTDALPETVIELAEKAGLKAVPTGLEHGTITVVANHVPHEITTFREDVETFGRHAVVAFATEVSHDARRRDFTMNALYARPDGTLVDPLGGLPDLRARRVRFIEDPCERIKEDFLRILRFFRFTAWYGDPAEGPDPEGLAAVAALSHGLSGLSRERVGGEIRKLLAAPDPAPAVAAMRSSGVLHRVLPGADDTALAPLIHLENEAHIAPAPIRRLASLGGDDVAKRLRLSKSDGKQLDLYREELSGTAGPAELGYRHGVGKGMDILLLRAAQFGHALGDDTTDALQAGEAANFPVRPRDLMPAYSGPALGLRLEELERAWIDSGFALTKEQLLKH